MTLISRFESIIKGLVQTFFYPLLPDPKVKAVILSSGRSGSNLLVSLLSSHPDIHQYGEVIGESHLRKKKVRAVLRMSGSAKYVRNCFKKRFFKPVVSIKFLYYQLRNTFGQKWDIHDVGDVLDDIRRDKQIKIIHLKRRNSLEILTSNKIARRTGEFVVRSPERKTHNVSVTLPIEECELFFKKIDNIKKEFDEYFQGHDVLEIYYKDLVQNRSAVCQKLFKFLGVKPCPLKADTYMQRKRRLSDRIENYEALKVHFRETPWEKFFVD